MDKNNLVGKKVITKNNDVFTIVEVIGDDDLKETFLKLDNGKMYSVFLGYKSGFIRFEDGELNKEMDSFIKNEDDIEEKKRLLEEENRKRIIEEERLFEEKKKDAIDKFRGEYGFLSNFYEVEVEYDGYTYRNSESAFQAQKDVSRREEFTNLTATKSKWLGKRVNLRKDWESVKLGIMEEIVRNKFSQNPELKQKLIDTGDRLLIEGNDWRDTFWGICNGKGQNHLGKILMKIREELK